MPTDTQTHTIAELPVADLPEFMQIVERKRRKGGGRPLTQPVFTVAESERVAEQFVSGQPAGAVIGILKLLRDFIAMHDERIFVLMTQAGYSANYRTFTRVLSDGAKIGLFELKPSIVGDSLERAGVHRVHGEAGHRYKRVWTLGKVGRVVGNKVWGAQFLPEGADMHMAHHAIAAETLFRAQKLFWDKRKYQVVGARLCPVMGTTKDGKGYVRLSPDGMLVEVNVDGGNLRKVIALEYHNEERAGRAEEKIESWMELKRDPAAWRAAWGLNDGEFPSVLVVYRYQAVYQDYTRAIRTMLSSDERQNFLLWSLADVMAGEKQIRQVK